MVKVKIINNSSREIPQELTEEMNFKPLSEVQQILEEYNLKCQSYEMVYDNKELSEQIITINDIK